MRSQFVCLSHKQPDSVAILGNLEQIYNKCELKTECTKIADKEKYGINETHQQPGLFIVVFIDSTVNSSRGNAGGATGATC